MLPVFRNAEPKLSSRSRTTPRPNTRSQGTLMFIWHQDRGRGRRRSHSLFNGAWSRETTRGFRESYPGRTRLHLVGRHAQGGKRGTNALMQPRASCMRHLGGSLWKTKRSGKRGCVGVHVAPLHREVAGLCRSMVHHE